MGMPKGSGLTKPLQLSTELADLVGAKKGEKLSRPEVVKRLWAHIKTNKLQDPENKQYFVPDTKMQPIFGKEKIRAFGMAKFLKTHLTNALIISCESVQRGRIFRRQPEILFERKRLISLTLPLWTLLTTQYKYKYY